MQPSPFPEHVDILIVGMGPVGAALANLLGRQGTRTLVIDKALEIFTAPRAIALDNEALRVLQMCGIEEGELDTVAIPEVRMLSPVFGQYGRGVTAGALDGHPRLVTFYQPQLEAILRRRAEAHDAVSIRLGCELVDFDQHSEGVTARLRATDGSEHPVRARFLIGADGAGSLVRRKLGLGFEGTTFLEDWLVVDATNVRHGIQHVEFVCDHRRPTPRMVAPGGRQRWEFKLRPGETREQMEQPETVRRLLEPWTSGGEPVIERIAVYRFHARLVERFSSGRAFLIGDAAHITPPFAGQGLVSGLRDVANLAWKLSWATRWTESGALLDSYDVERRPHARAMIRLARFLGRMVMPDNAAAALLTHGLLGLLSRVPRLRDVFERLEIKPANKFKRGCFIPPSRRSKLLRGSMLPQVWLREVGQGRVRLSDEFLGNGLALVGFGVDPTTGLSATDLETWRLVGGRTLQITPLGAATHETCADEVGEDLAGVLMPFSVPMGWVAVVRPDRVVMHDGPIAQVGGLLRESLALLSRDLATLRTLGALRPSPAPTGP